MRLPSLAVLAFALAACGDAPSCPPARALGPEEVLLWQEALSLAQSQHSSPPLLAFQKLDESCSGGWDVRAPGGECVGAYYLPACDCAVLPAGLEQAWPEFFRFLLKHELFHAALLAETGDPDKGHENPGWGNIVPPWEEQ